MIEQHEALKANNTNSEEVTPAVENVTETTPEVVTETVSETTPEAPVEENPEVVVPEVSPTA